MSVKRSGGKTGSSMVKKKARMTKEKVGNICFGHIAIVCGIAMELF